jgi:hypothetical protein
MNLLMDLNFLQELGRRQSSLLHYYLIIIHRKIFHLYIIFSPIINLVLLILLINFIFPQFLEDFQIYLLIKLIANYNYLFVHHYEKIILQ